MAKISIFIVTLVWLLCSDVHGVVFCSFDYYYKPGQGCVACPPCPAGQEITNNCGYDNNGVQKGDSCKNCTAGVSYNDKKTRGSCKNCHDCIGMGKIEIKACTLNSNAVCACPKGFYETEDGKCEKCSFCCGSNWERSKNIVPECRDQGLGRCSCPSSKLCSGKCSAPTTTPKSMTSAPKTTPKMTTPASESKPTISAQTSSSRIEGPKNNTTQMPSTAVNGFKKPGDSHENDSNAVKEEKEKRFGAFFEAGWIVLFCLLAVIIALVAVAVCHERTRKQISGRCCRKYGALTTDGDHDVTSVLVEGHHVEQAARDTINNATPIPPWEEPVPPFLQSSSTAGEMYCSCRTEQTGDEQMQCACTMNTSETSLEAHSSSSAETISEELQHYCNKRRQKRQQSSPSSSPRVSSSASDHYLVTCNSPSTGVTTSPCHGRTYSPPSACVTPSLPRMQSPDRFGETSSSNSTCRTPSPPCRRSPEHRCMTPSSHSSCGTSIPSRGRSPDPSNLSSFQNHSNFSDDHESCNQTDEYTQRSEPISTPISVEAFDKGHESDASKATRKKAPSALVTRNEGRFVGGRKSPYGKKEVTGVCCTGELQREELWPQNETGTDKDKGTPLSPVSDGSADRIVIKTSGNDIRAGEIGCLVIKTNVAVNPLAHPCKYRRIQRNEEHRCPECCPQPDDSFFQLIDRERLCLKEEICKELNRSYKDLAIFARVDKEMEEYEASPKPAECVLKKIKDSVPTITLEEFEEMLRGIKRLDVAQLIQDHHFSCTFCQRNRFDSKA